MIQESLPKFRFFRFTSNKYLNDQMQIYTQSLFNSWYIPILKQQRCKSDANKVTCFSFHFFYSDL